MLIYLVINAPDPGTVEEFRAPVARLRKAGHTVRPSLTFEGGDARRMARDACEHGAQLVIAAGGDGTINEVVNGIHDHIVSSGCEPPRIGLVPLGTANDLATTLRIPMGVAEAVELALAGETLQMDVALADERCFLNVSTGGFGAEATEEAAAEVKRVLGPLAYLITGVKKFVALEPSKARFVSDRVLYDGPFLLFAVGNSSRTGGGNLLTPRADPTDGLLDLCVVPAMSRVDFMRLLPELRTGNHLNHPGVVYEQVREVRVEAEEMLSVNADGEPVDCRSLHYRVSPHRVSVVVPGGTD